ncbi:endoribonuclease YbeY [Clostridium homopropionicum DSM 5847]|uniref:Endoribonuclease YbeY n=1 Tax=Clostridium homopropionicum DSM 5847 TaxID=1121318 RepID=A0A0L6ZEN4_9CLOT|nr:rRNA maturation RNase YbeY [Clostridium homopropionicum]KOA21233.1 endoribonuclease YbeY [Clostridium homopropionicum DSM 5847]SFG28152.1 probable rRNA maturation factor [Clostridium homopropionicum]
MIYIDNRQNKIPVGEELIQNVEKIIEYTLDKEQVNIKTEISVIFIDNEKIMKINGEQRGINKVTDVLSFPMLHYPKGKVYKEVYLDFKFGTEDLNEGELILGDVVISLEKAKEQSEEFGHSFLREVSYLTVHSILHLLGYDHMAEEDKAKMRPREEEILENFNIRR